MITFFSNRFFEEDLEETVFSLNPDKVSGLDRLGLWTALSKGFEYYQARLAQLCGRSYNIKENGGD